MYLDYIYSLVTNLRQFLMRSLCCQQQQDETALFSGKISTLALENPKKLLWPWRTLGV